MVHYLILRSPPLIPILNWRHPVHIVTLQHILKKIFIVKLLGFDPRSSYVGFVADKVALGQVFSQYFGFLCQFSFLQLLHIH
jgi:hypothetical protein